MPRDRRPRWRRCRRGAPARRRRPERPPDRARRGAHRRRHRRARRGTWHRTRGLPAWPRRPAAHRDVRRRGRAGAQPRRRPGRGPGPAHVTGVPLVGDPRRLRRRRQRGGAGAGDGGRVRRVVRSRAPRRAVPAPRPRPVGPDRRSGRRHRVDALRTGRRGADGDPGRRPVRRPARAASGRRQASATRPSAVGIDAAGCARGARAGALPAAPARSGRGRDTGPCHGSELPRRAHRARPVPRSRSHLRRGVQRRDRAGRCRSPRPRARRSRPRHGLGIVRELRDDQRAIWRYACPRP